MSYALNCHSKYVLLLFYYSLTLSFVSIERQRTLIRLQLKAFNYFYLLSLA